jgi:hypothetical protein
VYITVFINTYYPHGEKRKSFERKVHLFYAFGTLIMTTSHRTLFTLDTCIWNKNNVLIFFEKKGIRK